MRDSVINKILEYFGYQKKQSFDELIVSLTEWYYTNLVMDVYSDEIEQITIMQDLIIKMTKWFTELYQDEALLKIIPIDNSIGHNIKFDNEFLSNAYKSFYDNLLFREKHLLKNAQYPKIVSLENNEKIYLDKEGYITKLNLKDQSLNRELINRKIEEAVTILGIKYQHNNYIYDKLRKVLVYYQREVLFPKIFLEMVIYNILKEGGPIMGTRRAFIFAILFNHNINLAIKYIDVTKDKGLDNFLRIYLASGGNEDLQCFIDYYDHKKFLKTKSVGEILREINESNIKEKCEQKETKLSLIKK